MMPPFTNDVSRLTHVVQAGCSPLVGFRVRRVVAQRSRSFRHGLLVLRQLESIIKSGKDQRSCNGKRQRRRRESEYTVPKSERQRREAYQHGNDKRRRASTNHSCCKESRYYHAVGRNTREYMSQSTQHAHFTRDKARRPAGPQAGTKKRLLLQ